MIKQAVKRVNLTGKWTPVVFEKKCKNFFIKNYSPDSIFVSFVNNDSEDECFKIASEYAEEVSITEGYCGPNFSSDTVYIKGTGEVEVEALDIFDD